MELTPGYYRHFKDAVAPMKRGNPSGKGKVPLWAEAALPFHRETLRGAAGFDVVGNR